MEINNGFPAPKGGINRAKKFARLFLGKDKEKDAAPNSATSSPKTKKSPAENKAQLLPPSQAETAFLGDSRYTLRKNRKKFIRSIFQFIILGFVAYGLTTLFLTLNTYRPYDAQSHALSRDRGFIALSYIGTQRTTTQNLFGFELLRQHLKALSDLGYITITQQDIVDYYQLGKPIPEKALFLMFEDARRNSVIFSQKILEELNFKATMLTYPERFFLKDSRFLTADELARLENTTFWEIGSNGYRYVFINVFDRYGNYFNEMDLIEHTQAAPYLDLHLPQKRQSHYLMDYIRDRHGVPRETYGNMRDRISRDYTNMRDIYTNQVKSMPKLYVLLHPNTGKFGENDDVSAINEYWIKKLFKINFNRTGSSVNKPGEDIYNLTRMQPQAWWSVNHLLIKLRHELKEDVGFVVGEPGKAANWRIVKGAAQFQEKSIILTSFPGDVGLVKLKDSKNFQDMYVWANLMGNKLGVQKIYLRAGDELNRFLAVYIMDNWLYVTEKNTGVEKTLFKLSLDRHDGKEAWSVAQDKKMAQINELKVLMNYAESKDMKKAYAEQIKEKTLEVVPTIKDGAPEHVPTISAAEKGRRKVFIALRGGRVSLSIDGKEAVKNLPVENTLAGAFYLEAGCSGKSWADEVYDGVFDDLLITENTGIEQNKEQVLFDNRPHGMEAVKFEASLLWGRVVEFFISKI